jgi:molecular chaperone Hsp33
VTAATDATLDRPAGDHILRAMTDDGSFRVVAVRSSDTVRGVLEAQSATGAAARHLADLTTGAVLIRETMSPTLRVQSILKCQDPHGYLLADSHPSGAARGLISSKGARAHFQMKDAVLKVVRSLHDGRVHQSVVSVPDGGDVSAALMTYMQESEQITTMIVVSTLSAPQGVRAAGGYLVQLLPNAQRDALAIMTERLEDFRNIDTILGQSDFSPHLLLAELLYGMDHTMLGESNIRADCWCSRSSMMAALASLPRPEVKSMVDSGEVLEIRCDYCCRDYRVTPQQLAGLSAEN